MNGVLDCHYSSPDKDRAINASTGAIRSLSSLVWLGCASSEALGSDPEQVAPARSDDWLLEPASMDEARLLFPQLDEERALLRYQQLRLEMRERDGRGF